MGEVEEDWLNGIFAVPLEGKELLEVELEAKEFFEVELGIELQLNLIGSLASECPTTLQALAPPLAILPASIPLAPLAPF